MLNEDCYRLLNIPADANDKAIRKAYRDRSKELHPDVNPSPDAALQFAKLNEAMNTLLDPTSRLKHDDRFGYNKTVRNQDKNAKQEFSTFQKEKAEHLVQEWSVDYDKAMEMRERQRQEFLDYHRKRKRRLILAFVLVILAAAIIYLWFQFT